ncbi:MAG: SDR family oxidoreductase [Thermoleophilia bacterium]|nr:SDR family oxidoreductase [Thermoleophilia bacterium]
MDLSERRAFVTGGASGFGLAAALALLARGARVAVADVDRAGLEHARAHDPRLATVELDVTDAGAVRACVARAERELGGIDTVLACAGVIHVKPLAEVTETDWDRTLDVNLKGTFLVCQAAAPALRASGRGRIVAIASDAARRGYPWIQAYSASKFGLVGLCESLAAELAADRVTVNCVCPSACPTTGMGQGLTTRKAEVTGTSEAAVLAGIAAAPPLGRHATEADVVAAVLFFLSDGASFLTGVSLDIDGGGHLGRLPGAS